MSEQINTIDDTPRPLRWLLDRLQAFTVNWTPTEQEYALGRDRETSDLTEADVTSSLLRPTTFAQDGDRHIIALDIDVPAYLIPSSTHGHSHLYIDVPGGIPHDGYMALVSLLAHLGVLEKGYAQVSRHRGHTDLRLPWVRKGREPGLSRPQEAPEGDAQLTAPLVPLPQPAPRVDDGPEAF